MPPKQQTSLSSVLILIGAALVILVLCLAGGAALRIPDRAQDLFGAPDPSLSGLRLYVLSTRLLAAADFLRTPLDPSGEEQLFIIEQGSNPDDIIHDLEEAALIAHPDAFRTYLIYTGTDKTIQAGSYTLSPAMAPLRIIQTIQDATPAETTFTIIPGWRSEEIAAAMAVVGLEAAPEKFLEQVQNASAEGYLFPAAYQLPRDASPAELIAAFTGRFQAQIKPEMESGFSNQGLTPHEGVILASIVERESVLREEMPLIASVFLNRLEAGMTLSADPTVQYALGYNHQQQTWWTNPLSETDLRFSSPYNTYLNPGLPPGPICNPGMDALLAAAFPAESPYYYFRAACDGSGKHNFSRTFEEHLNQACP